MYKGKSYSGKGRSSGGGGGMVGKKGRLGRGKRQRKGKISKRRKKYVGDEGREEVMVYVNGFSRRREEGKIGDGCRNYCLGVCLGGENMGEKSGGNSVYVGLFGGGKWWRVYGECVIGSGGREWLSSGIGGMNRRGEGDGNEEGGGNEI